jgi:hypothetical protein
MMRRAAGDGPLSSLAARPDVLAAVAGVGYPSLA